MFLVTMGLLGKNVPGPKRPKKHDIKSTFSVITSDYSVIMSVFLLFSTTNFRIKAKKASWWETFWGEGLCKLVEAGLKPIEDRIRKNIKHRSGDQAQPY